MKLDARRFLLFYVVPVVLLLVVVTLPLIRGTETLIHRDVLHAHIGMKAAQAEAWKAGYLPLIDPYRAGGQPLAGNPNSVPFYPDNLLYLVAPLMWAFNAHFWIHFLLAPFTAAWMARAWGLEREAAWATGICYALSGFFLSHLSFYNLVAGAALAPALVAACLRAQQGKRWAVGAAGILWALLCVSGDPLMALLAFVLAASAVWVRAGTWRPRSLLRRVPVLPLAAAFAGGTLLAAPQWMEFLRILPLSFRGHLGFGEGTAYIQSFDPRQTLEWFLPLAFGRPDLLRLGRFWGYDFYAGFPQLYFSLYPGLAALALVLASGRPRSRRAWWAWGTVAVGIFFALGSFNPLGVWLFELKLLRYPVKLWPLVAVGASLLCGVGFQRVFLEGRRRPFALVLGLLALLYAAWLVLLLAAPEVSRAFLRGIIPPRYSDPFVHNEYLRWTGLVLFSFLLVALLAVIFRWLRKRPALAGAAVLLIHAGSQLFFLAPVYTTDSVVPYLTPPPALAAVPEDALVVHGSFVNLFGTDAALEGNLPEMKAPWYMRQTFHALYPSTGPLWGRRYQLNVSPEGLDAFLTEIGRSAVEQAEDPERLRLLRAWGVDVLLMGRQLAPVAETQVREVQRVPVLGGDLWAYHLEDPAPEVFFAGDVEPAGDLRVAVETMEDPGFDPLRTAVVPAEGTVVTSRIGSGGTARLVSEGPESLEVEVDARSSGVLVVQRAHLDLWRATVDGEPAALLPANLHRVGVELEPGRHRVRLWLDRGPLERSLWASLGGLLLLLGVFAWAERRLRRQ